MQPPLTPTARVVLGMLAVGRRTGYDIKRAVESSTRFFWGASFGQIYPELERLRGAGLVELDADVDGAASRRRTHRLTPAGQAALRAWLVDDAEPHFLYRDEALLRLFFGDLLTSDEVLAHVRRTRALLERDAERVRTEVLPAAREGSRAGRPLALETARFGLELTEWMATWYADLEHRLLDSEPVGVPAAHRAQAIMEVLTDDVQGA